MNKFFLPSSVYFGKDVVLKNSNVFKSMGSKPFIVTGKNSAKISGALDDVLTSIGGQNFYIFDKISENPPLSSVLQGAKEYLHSGCDEAGLLKWRVWDN